MSEYETNGGRRALLAVLESDIDYQFREINLLERALTHKSHAYENNDQPLQDNESLEFLGDAILGYVSSAELFARYPEMTEGKLSKVKAFLVSSASLIKRAQALELGKYIRLGYGEEKSGGRHKRAIQVDAYEALVAAIYLDGGIEQAERFIRREFFSVSSMFNLEEVTYNDYKSTLQERLHLLQLPEPRYKTVDEIGPDHRKTFVVEVSLHSSVLARAEGRTKKEGQQEVARLALENLKDGVPPVLEGLKIPEAGKLDPPGRAGRSKSGRSPRGNRPSKPDNAVPGDPLEAAADQLSPAKAVDQPTPSPPEAQRPAPPADQEDGHR